MLNKKMQKNWRYYLGMVFIAIAILQPILAIFVFFVPVPTVVKGIVVGIPAFGGVEIALGIGVAIMGKESYDIISHRVRAFFKRKGPPKPISTFRYHVGITLFILTLLVGWSLSSYLDFLLPEDRMRRALIFALLDITWISCFFVLGGEFWEKFKALFRRDVKITYVQKERS